MRLFKNKYTGNLFEYYNGYRIKVNTRERQETAGAMAVERHLMMWEELI